MTHEAPSPKSHEDLLNALRAVGGAWARYGLTVGRTALETSARTLQTTASALGQLAESIEERARALPSDTESRRPS